MYPRRGDEREPIRNVKAHLAVSKQLRQGAARYVLIANLLMWAIFCIVLLSGGTNLPTAFVVALLISLLSLGWYGLERIGDYMTTAVVDSRKAAARERAETARERRAQRKRGETPGQLCEKVDKLHRHLDSAGVRLGADGELIYEETDDSASETTAAKQSPIE